MISVGDKFGRLTVVKFLGKKNRYYNWECKCDCGKIKEVPSNLLNSGHTKSCGCLYKERSNEHKTKHSSSKTKLYHCWIAIKQRCLNPNSPYYSSYGGRGIKICSEWMDFNNFKKWAFQNGYSEKLTIDRIDVNGNYEPSNCRWATRIEQSNNRRVTRFVEIDGETKSVSEWCKIYNIKYTTVNNRIFTGWDMKEAVTTPTKKFIGAKAKTERTCQLATH